MGQADSLSKSRTKNITEAAGSAATKREERLLALALLLKIGEFLSFLCLWFCALLVHAVFGARDWAMIP